MPWFATRMSSHTELRNPREPRRILLRRKSYPALYGLCGAIPFSTFMAQMLGRSCCFLVIKKHARTSIDEHPHDSRADPSRTTADERDFALQA